VAIASIFLSTLLLSFATALLGAGIFGAYYGKGRSRSIGITFALVAVLLIALFCALTWPLVSGVAPVFDPYTVGRAMAGVGAAVVGTAVAIGLFMLSLMRS
jgi:hypothetical protein